MPQKLKREVEHINLALLDKEAEQKTLQESLDLALGRLDGAEATGQAPEVPSVSNLIRENCSLKKEVGLFIQALAS